jgi:hypothetical protein
MENNQEISETKNPVLKALIASYKKLVASPTSEEIKARRRVFKGTNSRIRKSNQAASATAKD